MNQTLQDFARQELKAGLAKLPESHHNLFKRMYSHKNLSLPINEVVDKMDVSKLDWAMTQVKNGLAKFGL